MPNIRRTSKKTGNNSRRTTTLSSTGTKTESYSNRPSKQSPRRTVSFNHKTGKTRTTYSQKLGGGWTKISTKTTGGSRRSSRSSGGDLSGLLSLPLILFGVIALSIMYMWPVTIPYILGDTLVIGSVIFVVWLFFALLPYIIWGSIIFTIIYLIGQL